MQNSLKATQRIKQKRAVRGSFVETVNASIVILLFRLLISLSRSSDTDLLGTSACDLHEGGFNYGAAFGTSDPQGFRCCLLPTRPTKHNCGKTATEICKTRAATHACCWWCWIVHEINYFQVTYALRSIPEGSRSNAVD